MKTNFQKIVSNLEEKNSLKAKSFISENKNNEQSKAIFITLNPKMIRPNYMLEPIKA
jgi:hypothetical protein